MKTKAMKEEKERKRNETLTLAENESLFRSEI
jgi:hypothetical protein